MKPQKIQNLFTVAFLAAVIQASGGCKLASPHQEVGTLKGILIPAQELLQAGDARAALERLREYRSRGFNAVALVIDDDTPLAELDSLRREAEGVSIAFYYWINVGRSPRLADRHPEWIAGMGSHDDWRRLFPEAPRPKEGERIGVYPWVPIWYRDVLEDRRASLARELRGHLDGVAGVLLNDVQGAPSACGCGNHQCRWTVDYGMERGRMAGGPEKAPGPPSALLIAALEAELPGVDFIPVLASECEEIDQKAGGTGYCGAVKCFDGLCWQEFSRELEVLCRVAPGPLAVLSASRRFGRELPAYTERGGWLAESLRLMEAVPARESRPGASAGRFIAVVEGQGLSRAEERRLVESALSSGARGVIVMDCQLEEGWEPRIVPAVSSSRTPEGPVKSPAQHGH
ncbi:MAG: hypothetical protein HY717_10715 [Planctomycetes bacterium]|nr:hypothetical protein [Planctomycetota bacterium]